MLRLLVRLACLIFALWLAMSSGMTSIARQQPLSDYGMAKYGLTVCDLPCHAGFVPGETGLDALVPLLVSHLPALKSWREYSPGNIYFEVGQTTSTILHSRGKFHSINLSLPDVSLAFLVERLHTPHCVEVLEGDGLVLMWDIKGFTVTTILWGEPDTALADEAAATQNLDIFSHPSCSDGTRVAWRGFVPLWFYERLSAGQG